VVDRENLDLLLEEESKLQEQEQPPTEDQTIQTPKDLERDQEEEWSRAVQELPQEDPTVNH
jgi:hypothetical protein